MQKHAFGKKALTLLLTLCMVFTTIAPAASSVVYADSVSDHTGSSSVSSVDPGNASSVATGGEEQNSGSSSTPTQSQPDSTSNSTSVPAADGGGSDSTSAPPANSSSVPTDNGEETSSSSTSEIPEDSSAPENEDGTGEDESEEDKESEGDNSAEEFIPLAIIDPETGDVIEAEVGDEVTLSSLLNRDDILVSYQWQRMQQPTKRVAANIKPIYDYADVQKEPEDSSSDSNQSKENEGVAEEPFADSEAATSQTVEDTPVCNKSICDIDVSLNVSNDMAPQGEERPSAEENHLDLRGVFDPEEEISFLFDDNPAPSDEAPAPEEAEDFELIDAAIVSDAGYFAVTYDANSNSGTFAFALETQGDRRFHESTVEECKNIEQATFEGAAALLEEIKNSGYTSIIIHMDKESCALLRRNAIYGIVDEYSESCIKYIQKAKEIVLKCHIRLTDETWTTEQIVTQSLVEGMAKKAIK